jgi:hypothetical protein
MLKKEDAIITELPIDVYHFRCVKSSFAPSRKGDPMITLEWEIAAPEFVEVNEQEVKTDKVKVRSWHVLTTKCAGYLFDFLGRCGIDAEAVDEENPDLSVFDGLIIKAALDVSDRIVKKRDGSPLLGDDGQPLTEGVQYGLGAIEGRSDMMDDSAF